MWTAATCTALRIFSWFPVFWIKAEYEALQLGHEFQEPFGEDVSDILADISKQYNDGAISRQTYVEMSYLIKDAKTEIERLKQEDLEAIAKQQELNRIDVFGGGE